MKLGIALTVAMALGLLTSQSFAGPLDPATPVTFSGGVGTASGAVSTGHEIFTFDGLFGQVITIDLDVTRILPGTQYEDDDSMLWLFDGAGKLIAQNDDEHSTTLQSKIANFALPVDGTYYIGVTTYPNEPLVDGNDVVTGWSGNGGSSIEYTLTVTGVPEPSTMLLTLLGGLGLAGRRRIR